MDVSYYGGRRFDLGNNNSNKLDRTDPMGYEGFPR